MKILDGIINYKLFYKLYFFINNKNHTHIILYGNKSVGKTYLIKHLFAYKYSTPLKQIKNESYNLSMNNDYYYFNCSTINDKVVFLNYFKEIIRSYDYYTDKSKYIILDHFEDLTNSVQNSLKFIFEKAYHTCKIIIITKSYNKIIQPIKSRFIGIRLPDQNYIDKKNFLKENYHVKCSEFELINDCKKMNIDVLINKYSTDNYDNMYDNTYQKFKKIIYLKKLDEKNFLEIRKLSSLIKELNINITDFLKDFIKDYNSKIDVQKISNLEYLVKKSYRELIHIEHLILNLNYMINNI